MGASMHFQFCFTIIEEHGDLLPPYVGDSDAGGHTSLHHIISQAIPVFASYCTWIFYPQQKREFHHEVK